MPIIVVYNPASGDRSAKSTTETTILPLLTSHNLIPDRVAATEHVGHAGTLLISYIEGLSSAARAQGITLVLVSGDGTLHEIVNALYNARAKQQDCPPFPSLRIVLIPSGTANALHATFFPPSSTPDAEPTLLASLLSFLSATPRLVHLTLAHTTISPPSAPEAGGERSPSSSSTTTSESESESVVSVVVTSTALHASILHDSEALRASVPGVERFKLAAAQNETTWYRARVRLLAPVQRYDVASGAFVSAVVARNDKNGTGDDEPLEPLLSGPFVYFLSTVNVDRLEPLLRIAPLQRALPPPHGARTMDVLAVRPLRDPSLGGKSGDGERERFKDRLWGVFGGAYQDGTHIHARYDAQDGNIDSQQPVVEYFRVGGWEWIPEEHDEKAHLLCADGTIFHAPKGGKIRSTVVARTAHDLDIAVYA
ncbi:ATP-NAD kinase-like domain-containing protein, partial [Lactifluus subvellereus]